MSQDINLLTSFKNGLDIHQTTADFIGTSDRKIAKAVNFGVIYGISAFGLSKNINISIKEAKEYIDKFYEKYPQIKSFFEKTIEDGEKNGYVESLFGRKRYLPGLTDRNAIIKNAAKREAMNMPIQATATGDIIKLAMIEVSKYLQKSKLKTKILLQVHDELILNVPKSEKEIVKKDVVTIME